MALEEVARRGIRAVARKRSESLPLGAKGILILFFFLITVSATVAQLPTGTILGVVKDASGAVMPGVTLTARNTDTGQTRTAVSAGDGSYRFSALPVGGYEVRAEQSGFQTDIRRGLTLTVAQEAIVDFTLAVGAVAQTVVVTAEAPLVNTTTGSLGGLVDEQKVEGLPLNGRNYINLTLLQPGVTQHVNKNLGQVGTWYSSNGAPVRSNNYLLDGASMVFLHGVASSSASNTNLGVEGIREWRVVTNSFSAEYGMTMGSQMLIVSKGGTNAFHGSLFEFLRNSALDARNFFDYQTIASNRRLPAFTRNNFGGSFGGPIKKDRTFFFGTFEALRERTGITTISNTIPASAKVDGGLVPQISPVIKPFLQFYPDPNLPNNQYTFPFAQPNTENYGQMRLDQTFSASDTAFGRYTVDDDDLITPNAFPAFKTFKLSRSQFATLSESHVFSPTLLNTYRFSFSRTNFLTTTPSTVIGPQYSFVPGQSAGGINIGGVSAWAGAGGGGSVTEYIQNIFTWSDDLFYTRGRHALKFGALINHVQQYMLINSGIQGAITFPNITSFLLGQPSSYSATTATSILDRVFHPSTLGFYVQDDLRVLRNLTLNLGLRYEFSTEYQETRGYSAALRNIYTDTGVTVGPLFKNNSLHNIGPRLGFAWDVIGNGRTAVRGGFGLLYDVGNIGAVLINKARTPPFTLTSLVVNPPPLASLPLVIPPAVIGNTANGVDYSLRQPHMLQYNRTVERQLPWGIVASLAYGGSRGINILMETEGNPTVPQILPDGRKFWTGNEPRINPNVGSYSMATASGNSWYNSLQFGLLKRLSNGLEFQTAYTWSKAMDEGNAQLGGDSATSNSFPQDPGNVTSQRGLSVFDTPQNLRFNAIYHLPNLANTGSVKGDLLNGWGMSGILSVQSGYPFTPTLGSNRSRSKVGGGGTLSFGTAAADRPDLVLGRDNSNITQGTTSGCPGVAAGQRLGTPNLEFDPCAFTLQPAGFLGTTGRDILRGPGFANLDFSITKETALRILGESGMLEFRAEIFNILNRANFVTPQIGWANAADIVFAGAKDGELPLPTAGAVTSTVSSSRQIQLALKIRF